MENRCEFCKVTGIPVYFKTVIAKSGEAADIFLCESCYRKIEKEIDWIEKNISELKKVNLTF